jgi:hypothetical protein
MKSILIGQPLEDNRLGRFAPCDTRSNDEIFKQQVLEQQTCINSIVRETVCGVHPQIFGSTINWNGTDCAGLESPAMALGTEGSGDKLLLGASGTVKTESEGKHFFLTTAATHNAAWDFPDDLGKTIQGSCICNEIPKGAKWKPNRRNQLDRNMARCTQGLSGEAFIDATTTQTSRFPNRRGAMIAFQQQPQPEQTGQQTTNKPAKKQTQNAWNQPQKNQDSQTATTANLTMDSCSPGSVSTGADKHRREANECLDRVEKHQQQRQQELSQKLMEANEKVNQQMQTLAKRIADSSAETEAARKWHGRHAWRGHSANASNSQSWQPPRSRNPCGNTTPNQVVFPHMPWMFSIAHEHEKQHACELCSFLCGSPACSGEGNHLSVHHFFFFLAVIISCAPTEFSAHF